MKKKKKKKSDAARPHLITTPNSIFLSINPANSLSLSLSSLCSLLVHLSASSKTSLSALQQLDSNRANVTVANQTISHQTIPQLPIKTQQINLPSNSCKLVAILNHLTRQGRIRKILLIYCSFLYTSTATLFLFV